MSTETARRALQRARCALDAPRNRAGVPGEAIAEAVAHLDVAAVGLCGPKTAAVSLVGALVSLVAAARSTGSARAGAVAAANTLIDRAIERAEGEIACDASSPDSSS
jgi:hypothetical protein